MIVGDYKNWTGEQKFPTKSSFTLRGFEYEFKKWDLRKQELPEDKHLFTLWMIEPSPDHPAVMGKIEVFEDINFVFVNPFFEKRDEEKIYDELIKASREQLLIK